MKEKISKSITKLINTDINMQQAYLYFNVYLTRSVFFGSNIVELTPLQEKELMRIYERSLLRKIGLSKTFSCYALYTRRSALGIGIIKPSTIVAMATLKQFFGSMRLLNNTSDMIKAILEFSIARYGYSINRKSHGLIQY